MPWQFTTPISIGVADPDAPSGEYTHCRATLTGNYPDVDPPCLRLNLAYGWVAAGMFVGGKAVLNPDAYPIAGIVIEGADYTTLITTHEPNPGEKTYAAAKRAVYEELNRQGKISAGTVT